MKIALVKSNGEVASIAYPSVLADYEDRQVYGEHLAVHVSENVDNETIFNSWYWDGDGEGWGTRQAAPSGEYDWVDNAWALNSDRLWEIIRGQRAEMIFASDWTQTADSPFSDSKKAEWATYRQALRDIPTNNSSVTSVSAVVWPTPPA